MCLPAAMARLMSFGRSWVEAASKNISSLDWRAFSRSVVHRSTPYFLASSSTFAALRPTRIGSGIRRSPLARDKPPCLRISRMDRTRCWFIPMRPVTPCMMMPTRFKQPPLFDRFENTAKVADGARRRGRTVGHVVERIDGDVAAIAVALQRGDERREALLALTRALAVAVVHLHVRDHAFRQPALDELREAFLLHAPRRAAIDHGLDGRRIDLRHHAGGFFERVDERRLLRGERLDAVHHARFLRPLRDRGEAFLGALRRGGACLAG